MVEALVCGHVPKKMPPPHHYILQSQSPIDFFGKLRPQEPLLNSWCGREEQNLVWVMGR